MCGSAAQTIRPVVEAPPLAGATAWPPRGRVAAATGAGGERWRRGQRRAWYASARHELEAHTRLLRGTLCRPLPFVSLHHVAAVDAG
eukprot:356244-Chlamydomonas_euryale.AAC.12